MKKYLFFFVFLSFLSHLANAQKKEKILAIGFYNVENFFHPENDTAKLDEDFTPTGAYHYSNEVYLQKLHNIATVFKQLGTDVTPVGAAIIGIAEIENDKVLNDLVQQPEIRNRKYQWVWHPTADVRGISTALLYNPKYFQLLSSKPFHVPLELVGQKRPTRDVLYVKGILTGDRKSVV